jgi:hypothetical protein
MMIVANSRIAELQHDARMIHMAEMGQRETLGSVAGYTMGGIGHGVKKLARSLLAAISGMLHLYAYLRGRRASQALESNHPVL